jgi:hypothetical protein
MCLSTARRSPRGAARNSFPSTSLDRASGEIQCSAAIMLISSMVRKLDGLGAPPASWPLLP